ncbi:MULTISPECIES: hypothetical protein [Bacillus]|uniref:Lactococcin 972 family bacteriocin n=1 Tax=Bacillus glycinifermentans TaxID=1664069 RepID=A0A0T6BI05_9BACI|nr:MULTISPECIES: hypothetical protein [Bacillus]KRT87079.1 hypothetical protein AB447_208920 [Bacillus glycinifermentans]MEC0341869.1 hypothetical protein [Bacillus sonorensis]MEC0457445.1 hypothetical protein [Bacillus sonorensis]MEC0487128.1 hypothetical protein [Bacillus glycinifermentans]MEC0530760.1 hypothetical protein [Bacillus sonorensis]
MKRKSVVLSAVALAGLVGSSLIPSNAHASEYLGWDEESGIVNPDNYSISAKNKPDSHKGWSELNYKMNRHRAVGVTKWKGKRHYTTARYERRWPFSGVITSSGRVWGTGKTVAKSGWCQGGTARTYWGN